MFSVLFCVLFVKSAKSIPEPFSSFISMQTSSNRELRKTEKPTHFRSVQYSKIQDPEAEVVNDSPKRVKFGVNYC